MTPQEMWYAFKILRADVKVLHPNMSNVKLLKKPFTLMTGNLYIQRPPGVLLSYLGKGDTPHEAIEDGWRRHVTNLGKDELLVMDMPSKSNQTARRRYPVWDTPAKRWHILATPAQALQKRQEVAARMAQAAAKKGKNP